jgi:hypothetical protein
MANHRMEHHRSRINTSPVMLEATIVETQKQHFKPGIENQRGIHIHIFHHKGY